MESLPGVFVPLRTVSEANAHEHWRVRQRRAKRQRNAATLFVRVGYDRLTLPATIRLTRYGKGQLDDDNLAGSFKHIRDGIADAFGVDDRDKRYTWVYRQERSKFYGVRIEIE